MAGAKSHDRKKADSLERLDKALLIKPDKRMQNLLWKGGDVDSLWE